MNKNLDLNLQNLIFLEKKKKTWRASKISNWLFLASLLFCQYFIFWGSLAIYGIDLSLLVGFNNFYINFVFGYLIFVAISYFLYVLIFNLFLYLTYGAGVCAIYERNHLRSYFLLWFAVRNFLLGFVYLFALVSVVVMEILVLIKMILTILTVVAVFFDLKNNVVGDTVSLFVLKKMANVLIVYYLILFISVFLGVI